MSALEHSLSYLEGLNRMTALRKFRRAFILKIFHACKIKWNIFSQSNFHRLRTMYQWNFDMSSIPMQRLKENPWNLLNEVTTSNEFRTKVMWMRFSIVNVHEIKLLLIMQAHLLSFLIMFSICKNNDVDRMITLQFSLSVGVWCSCLERSGKVVTEMNQQLYYLNGSNERHAQK